MTIKCPASSSRRGRLIKAQISGWILTFGFLTSCQYHCQADEGTIRFVPRTDTNAAHDLESLRFALSKVKDSKGNIDPLADYVKTPKIVTEQERNKRPAWKQDDEAWATPELTGNQGKTYRSPRIELESEEYLYSPTSKQSENRQDDAALVNNRPKTNYTDGFRPAGFGSSILASAPYSTLAGVERLSRLQEVPYGSQGTPTNPGISNLPSGPGGLPNFPYNPPINPGTTYDPNAILPGNLGANPTGINPPVVNPPAFNPNTYNTNPVVVNPGGATGPPFQPGAIGTPIGQPQPTIMPAPPPSYPPPPVNTYPPLAYPTPQVRSPSDANPPRYNTAPSIVNSQPFVSGRPCETDARFMVSPSVFRPASCSTCGTSGTPGSPYANPYVPGGTPFSYAPPTYFPTRFAGYNTTFRPLIGFGQDITQAQLGRGIIGQPTAYMSSQPLRNILRYLFP